RQLRFLCIKKSRKFYLPTIKDEEPFFYALGYRKGTEKGKKEEVKFCVWDLHKDMFILQK
ncbi:hypothetical protein, partial [Staphylococcus aureus]|uniref:hypothetical protein n=1 Tax=Staphylococcus aureus TaxID=1280 RepID=UPI00202DC372